MAYSVVNHLVLAKEGGVWVNVRLWQSPERTRVSFKTNGPEEAVTGPEIEH